VARLFPPVLFPRPALAAACDAGGLLVFAVVGLLSHHGGVSGRGLARDAVPLLCGWFAAAALARLYAAPSVRRLAATWLAGVTGAVVVRALVLGHRHVGSEAAFLGVSLTFTLVFVVAARLVAGLAVRPR
jgi:Protein of unknown function (DUF3054)